MRSKLSIAVKIWTALTGSFAVVAVTSLLLFGQTGTQKTKAQLMTQFADGQASGSITPTFLRNLVETIFSVGGDCAINTSTFAFTCSKTGGVSFATSATTDTTNATNLASGTVNVARLPTGIDAVKIGGGAVSNTEFSYLDGVTSAIQTQLTTAAPTTLAVGGGSTISKITKGTITYTYPGQGVAPGSITLTGVVQGDVVLVTPRKVSNGSGPAAVCVFSATVTATDTVKIASAMDYPISGTCTGWSTETFDYIWIH